MRRAAGFLLAGLVTACGIGVAGIEPLDLAPGGGGDSGAEGDGATPRPDGGGSTADGGTSVEDRDGGGGGLDATPGCQVVIDDRFQATALDGRWRLAGVATFDGPGGVALTHVGDHMLAGGLWLTQELTFRASLTATFHYKQSLSGGSPGVGIGIGWVRSNPSWLVGDQGLNVGICNSSLDGVAASLRLQSTIRLDAIAGISGDCGTIGGMTPSPAPDLADGELVLALTPGLVKAATTGGAHSQNVTVSATGFVGFTAATTNPAGGQGGFTITEAKVEVCN